MAEKRYADGSRQLDIVRPLRAVEVLLFDSSIYRLYNGVPKRLLFILMFMLRLLRLSCVLVLGLR